MLPGAVLNHVAGGLLSPFSIEAYLFRHFVSRKLPILPPEIVSLDGLAPEDDFGV
jgi:hypothetical protein